jgi:hypothetical protein
MIRLCEIDNITLVTQSLSDVITYSEHTCQETIQI